MIENICSNFLKFMPSTLHFIHLKKLVSVRMFLNVISVIFERVINKDLFLLTTTKVLDPTQDILHVIVKLRRSAFLWCATYLVWWVLLRVDSEKSGKFTSVWQFFVLALLFYLEKIVLDISKFFIQKNYQQKNYVLLIPAIICWEFF